MEHRKRGNYEGWKFFPLSSISFELACCWEIEKNNHNKKNGKKSIVSQKYNNETNVEEEK